MDNTAKQQKTKRSPGELAALGNNVESRHFTTTFEMRGEGDQEGRCIYGYAAVFGKETDMGWYTEIIEAGAFDEAINSSDCRALFNHHPDHLLARQSSGTLRLSIDATGLAYEFDTPDTTMGNDLLVMIGRQDLKESSFAFTISEQVWEETQTEDDGWEYKRIIKKVERLYDVAPVTYPAYGDTTVAKRSLADWQTKNPKPATKNQEKRMDTATLSAIILEAEATAM